MIWVYIFSGFGLILDFIGVVGLFYIKIANVEKPYGMANPISMDTNKSYSDSLVSNLIKNANKAYDANKNNEKKAKRFFYLLVIGFIMQILSVIMSVFIYTNSTGDTKTKEKCSHANYNNKL